MNRYALSRALYVIHHASETVLSDTFELKQKETGRNTIVCRNVECL